MNKDQINILKQYIKSLEAYPPLTPNCHHRNGLAAHSVWSARQADLYITNCEGGPDTCPPWLINLLVLGMDEQDKMLSVVGALFHDMGKCDGDRKSMYKPNHPDFGFNQLSNLTNAFLTDNKVALDTYAGTCFEYIHHWCVSASINNKDTYIQLMATMAIVSKYHQYLGNIMQKGGRIKDIQNFVQSVDNDYKSFKVQKITSNIIAILLLISLSDVQGAWKVSRRDVSKSNFPFLYQKSYGGNRFDCKNENEDCKHICSGNPWQKYGYENIGELINMIMYTVGELRIKKQKLDITVLDGRSNLFKAVQDSKMYRNSTYNLPTWAARDWRTAKIYYDSKSWGNTAIIKWKIKKGKSVNLLRLDSPENCIFLLNIYKSMLMDDRKTIDLDFLNQIKSFIHVYITQIHIGLEDIKTRQDGFDKLTSLTDAIVNGNVVILRNSKHNIDRDVAINFLCVLTPLLGIQIDGYISSFIPSKGGGKFHEEIMICKPADNLQYVGDLVL